MKTKRGRPRGGTGKAKAELMQIRLDDAEKRSFADAAELAGQKLSVWVRDQLRRAARQTLEEFDRPVPFLAVPAVKNRG